MAAKPQLANSVFAQEKDNGLASRVALTCQADVSPVQPPKGSSLFTRVVVAVKSAYRPNNARC